MYIKKISIKEFRVLKDIEINFQTDLNDDTQNGNVINVIAGVNGCGKTSLLDAIFLTIHNPFHVNRTNEFNLIELSDDFGFISNSNWKEFSTKIGKLNEKNINNFPPYNDPQIIYIPSQQAFSYTSVSQLETKYSFARRIETNKILGNAEFYIKEYVLKRERESNISDPKERTKNAVNAFNAHFLGANLLTKLVDLSKNQFNRPIFSNVTGKEVTIDQLSDGEKQLYGRVIALMMLEPRNSIILIDEPEIALHPAWQQEIMKIYGNIGQNNQFIVATHSPQVIRSVSYKNRVLLYKNDDKIKYVPVNSPPSGIDVNSILCEIMGADPTLENLIELHNQYRSFVEKHLESSNEAIEVKQKILNMENDNSAFMHEMNFLIELRDIPNEIH